MAHTPKLSPATRPELFRLATLADLQDTSDAWGKGRVQDFYTADGTHWRTNGKPQLWKRSPGKVRLPVKYGLYAYGAIHEYDLGTIYVLRSSDDRP